MTAPQSYTEASLLEYIRNDVLKGSAVALGWTDGVPLAPPSSSVEATA